MKNKIISFYPSSNTSKTYNLKIKYLRPLQDNSQKCYLDLWINLEWPNRGSEYKVSLLTGHWLSEPQKGCSKKRLSPQSSLGEYMLVLIVPLLEQYSWTFQKLKYYYTCKIWTKYLIVVSFTFLFFFAISIKHSFRMRIDANKKVLHKRIQVIMFV